MAHPPFDISDEHLAKSARRILDLRRLGITNLAILDALETIQRTDFTIPAWRELALSGDNVPIPCGQSMSGFIEVAMMADALQLLPDHRLLLGGAGAGYACAILSHLVHDILAFDRFQTLVDLARTNLDRHKILNVTVHLGDVLDRTTTERDGYGDFDRILLTGAISEFPTSLRRVLGPRSQLLAPLNRAEGQAWCRFTRGKDGAISIEEIAPSFCTDLIPGLAKML